jgi:hypothetical protein
LNIETLTSKLASWTRTTPPYYKAVLFVNVELLIVRFLDLVWYITEPLFALIFENIDLSIVISVVID